MKPGCKVTNRISIAQTITGRGVRNSIPTIPLCHLAEWWFERYIPQYMELREGRPVDLFHCCVAKPIIEEGYRETR